MPGMKGSFAVMSDSTVQAVYNTLLEEIRRSRKYRDLDIPEDTLYNLLAVEIPRHRTAREAVQAVREKLHNIVAPYLGDPDYPNEVGSMQAAFESGDPQAVQQFCQRMLEAHASTKERIPLLNTFYNRLFKVTGKPQSILDLACALHPFGLPWMGLPVDVQYYAYDLHHPRVEFINRFFEFSGRPQLAVHQDILIHPPEVEADIAFFFKEAHRFEQRLHNCNIAFWRALRVRYLLVSLPTENLTKKRSLLSQHRELVYKQIAGENWPVEEILFDNEIVFVIRKA